MPLFITILPYSLSGAYDIFKHPVSEEKYVILMKAIFRKHADALLQLYPCAAYNASDCRGAVGQVLSDFILVCPTVLLSEFAVNASDGSDVFAYLFAHRASWVPQPVSSCLHAFSFLFFFFFFLDGCLLKQWT